MTRRSRLSVAMTTYNGGRHLRAQLASIAAQTRPPDELVVVDDGSTDGTLDVVQDFARQPDLRFDVRVESNAERLGPVPNVERAIRRCEGDVVVLADQDDIWRPERLEVVEAVLGPANEGGTAEMPPGAMFSDAWIIDDTGTRTGRRLWEAFGFTGRRRKRWQTDPLGVLLQGSVVTGATTAVRSDALDLILPLSSSGWHDHWIALLVAATTGVAAYDTPLVEYRVHGANATGIPRDLAGERDRRLDEPDALAATARQYGEAIDRLLSAGADAEVIARLHEKVEHLRVRTRLPSNPIRRAGTVAREVASGRYGRCSAGVRSVAFDVVYGRERPGADGGRTKATDEDRPST